MEFEIQNGVLHRLHAEFGTREAIIPRGVHTIGAEAFLDCVFLHTVWIPEGVTCISDRAFKGCVNLRGVQLPESLTEIGAEAFNQCCMIQQMRIPAQVKRIGRQAFVDCSRMIQISLPEHLTEIEPELFVGCSALTQIRIPDSVTVIGEKAFRWCIALTEVSFPKHLRSIGDKAFEDCTGIGEIMFPETLACIGDDAFHWCRSLTEAILPPSLTCIGKNAFRECTKLIRADIPDSVISIGDRAFSGCEHLKEIALPANAVIGAEAFERTAWLDKHADDFVIIGKYLYRYKGNDKNPVIPKELTHISSKAFCHSQITGLCIPEGVILIGREAFAQCSELEFIRFPDSLERMEKQELEQMDQIRLVFLRGIRIDWQLLRKSMTMLEKYVTSSLSAEESEWNILLSSLRTKDFSYVFDNYFASVQLLVLAGFYVQTGDQQVREFLLAHAWETMHLLIVHENPEALHCLLEERDFVGCDMIDMLIHKAIEQGNPEIRTMLLHYKFKVLGYGNPEDMFSL